MVGAFSFDSEKQVFGDLRQAEVPASAYLPVITRGTSDWNIQPQSQQQQRVPGGFDQDILRPLHSKSSQSSFHSSELSHERYTLTDAPVTRTKTVRSPGRMSEHHQHRPKSILVKRDGEGPRHVKSSKAGTTYRHRTSEIAAAPATDLRRNKTGKSTASRARSTHHSSTSFASPKMLQTRASTPLDSAPVFVKPAKPRPAQELLSTSTRGAADNGPPTRDLFRPLPPPPAFDSK
jgi:hypothetical protein